MSFDKNTFIKNILKEIEEENLAIFAGAGLSIPAGYVSWSELLRPIAEELKLKIEKEYDLISLAQYHINENCGNRSELNRRLIEEFTEHTNITQNHKILARLPIKTYWTTNYDKLIEKSLQEQSKKPDIKYNNKEEKLLELSLEYIKQNRLDKAEQFLVDLIDSTNQKSYVAFYNLGVIKEANGEYVYAQKYYKN